MNRNAYNTAEGIQCKLTSLHELNELIRQRHEAGYDRGERLTDFYIMGRWVADACGNFGKIIGEFVPKEHFPHISDVLTRNEFFEFLRVQGVEVFISQIMTSDIPRADLLCAECGKLWTINNCHDTVVTHKTTDIPLTEFVGRQLWEVQRTYTAHRNAVYRMQDNILIRNNRFIDLGIKPGYDTLKVNERGWVGKADGVTREYVIQPGDDGFFNVWHFCHRACNEKRLAGNMEQSFRDIFIRAQYEHIELEAIPNRYCSCERCAPWYRVTTPQGVITIGWQKRVINIDWSETGADLLSLFADEDVTKSAHCIHAWSTDKAVDYLSRIRRALPEVA